MDPLRDFFVERCTITEGAWAMAADLLAAYDRWRVPNNEREFTMAKFGRMLVERGFAKDRVKRGPDKGKVFYARIGLRADEVASASDPNPSPGGVPAQNPSLAETPANRPKTSGLVDAVKGCEGKIGSPAINAHASGDTEKPFPTLHSDQTLHQKHVSDENLDDLRERIERDEAAGERSG
jgi:hypothetical protein